MALTRTKTFQNFIAGEWADAASGETFESVSPADGETLGTFPKSSAEDVDRAVAAAKAAYEEWRLVPAPERGNILYRFAQLLIDQKDDLTDLMTHEMGKVKAEAGGDVQEAIDMTLYMAGQGRRLFGQTTPSELRDKFNMSVRMPIGVVGAITLTGSRETGVEVMRNAADTLKHVHLELGGKNAIIVLDDADLDLAVDGIVWSAFGTSGQRCTAASRVIVQEGAYDALSSKLVAAAEAMRLGPGWEDDTDVGPVINRSALEKIHSYTEIGKDEGAKLLTGGEVATGNGLDKGYYYRPTIFGGVDAQMRIAQEEIFGPTTALIRVRDLDEAIRVSNGIRYGLSSAIFTRDVNKAFRAMRDLVAGITYINAGTIGAEVHLPFGGSKDTGNGHREAGQAALDVFTEWKSIYVDYSGKLQKAQIDTAS